ncbi:HEAT repeat domain-containing protein [Novipirellula sp. SH528]|uniref:HEAT repeat domain-containing protein n=1 Tax=Novipirellula sp. SH528 TaxID=3454466 RepID=UPI003FA01B6B
MDKEIQFNELRDLLTQLCGSFQQDDPAIAKLRTIRPERLFQYLRELLNDPDFELRCKAALAVFYCDPTAGLELLLPVLNDPEWGVRVHICGLLHDIADKRAIQPLIHLLKMDPSPMVRNTAAYALGGIGDPTAIPALIEAVDNDHEPDELGHTASGCAQTALDNILKTNHTRIKFADGLCTMQPKQLDLDELKTEAMEFYRTL